MMGRKLISVFEIQCLVKNGTVIPRRTIFDSEKGPLTLIRFDNMGNMLKIIMEDAQKKSYILGNSDIKSINLKIDGEPEITYEKWEEAP
jgi:hypothetical protein